MTATHAIRQVAASGPSWYPERTRFPPFTQLKRAYPGVLVRWCREPSPFKPERDVLTSARNPKYPRVLYRAKHLPPDSLQWKVNALVPLKEFPKAIQRNRMARRWKAAIVVALQEKNYDVHGRRKTEAENLESRSGLVGTAEVMVYAGDALTCPFDWLLKHARTMVAQFEAQQRD